MKKHFGADCTADNKKCFRVNVDEGFEIVKIYDFGA